MSQSAACLPFPFIHKFSAWGVSIVRFPGVGFGPPGDAAVSFSCNSEVKTATGSLVTFPLGLVMVFFADALAVYKSLIT